MEMASKRVDHFCEQVINMLQLIGNIVRSTLSQNLSICGAELSPNSFKIIGRLFGYKNKIKIVQFCKKFHRHEPHIDIHLVTVL